MDHFGFIILKKEVDVYAKIYHKLSLQNLIFWYLWRIGLTNICLIETLGKYLILRYDENKEFFQEKAVNSLLYSIAVSYGDSNPMERSFELVRELTKGKSAVIIGRCSGAVYEKDPEATTIFLHADRDCRIERIMKRDNISKKEATHTVKEVDEKRAEFQEQYTSKKWGDGKEYDLCIDTGKIGIDHAVEMILQYIRFRQEA